MFRFSRIGLKLSVVGSLFILSIIAVMARMILNQTETAMISEMQVRAEFFARRCGEAIFPTVDTFTLHLNAQQMLKEKAIVYVSVLNKDGKIISHSDSKRIGELDQSPVASRALGTDRTLVQNFIEGGIGYFDIATPILAGGERRGTVRLGFTQGSMDRALHDAKAKILWIAGIAIGSAVLGTILIAGWLMYPLPLLANAAKQVGAGHLEIKVQWNSSDEVGELAKAFEGMVSGLRDREKIRNTFGRFVSPEIAEVALRGDPGLSGQQREVTILLVDLRNFTRFSEQLPPDEVVRFLNGYFSQMVEIIQRHKGTVDKFIGDAILAIFGAPLDQPDHAPRAVACALEIRERIAQINAERQQHGWDPLRNGMAINTGTVVAGTIGSQERMEYTVIGDAVNLAARVETLNPKLGTDILVTHNTFQLTRGSGFHYKYLGLTPVRGRIEPVSIYQLLAVGAQADSQADMDPAAQVPIVTGGTPQSALTTPIPALSITTAETARHAPTIGRYEIEKKLAEGAMGAVYLGRDPKLKRKVAIKTLRFGEILTPEETQTLKKRFFVEAEAAGRLSHPAIVQVFDAGESQEVPYIAMEYLEGEDLSRVCKKGQLLEIPDVIDIGARIAEALDYAHANGVVHRDIKPSNIMLLKDKSLRIMDFGIARIIESSITATGTITGTPAYMSPEQVAGKKVDGRSDLFSLGVVLFEMLTGEKPFKGGGEHMGTLLFQIALQPHQDPRSLNPAVPPQLARVLDEALQKKPESRILNGREMAKLLRQCMPLRLPKV